MDRDTPSLPPNVRALADDADEEQTLERIWTELDSPADAVPDYDVDSKWDELAGRLDLNDGTASARAPQDRAADRAAHRRTTHAASHTRLWTRAVAVALLVAAVVGLGAWWGTRPVTVATAAGERTTVTLPDGSTAELNGRTSLTYTPGFTAIPLFGETDRRVELEGEAFFSVVEADRPFWVETPNARVEVLGTEFNVRARPQGNTPETRVTLSSGRVEVASLAPVESAETETVTLSESGHATLVAGMDGVPSNPFAADLKYVGAWREGGFALVDAPLPNVLRELEHRFGTPLELQVPPSETETMTLHYAADATLKGVLRDICLIQNLSFRETSRGYELVRD